MKEIEKKIYFSSDKILKFERFISDQSARWIILFVSVMITYIYILYVSYKFVDSPSASDHHKQTALLFNPSLGGYNKVRGDPNSISLFDLNPSECILFSIIIIATISLYWKIVVKQTGEKFYIKIFQFILAWLHSVILLFLIPINNFHKRLLYNFRSFLATICNEPLQELWIAFLFIVVLPCPGSTSHKERITWLAGKLAVFFVLQNFLLGSPNYSIEPVEDNTTLPGTTLDYVGYIAFVLIVTVLVLRENCKQA
jgi:hypothetical protein